MDNTIKKEDLELFDKDVNDRETSSLIRHTIARNGISGSSIDETIQKSLKDTFSIDLKTGDVCNQKRSGRCWMFAGLNVLRTILIKNLKVKNFELSQAYLQFYDKLEKCNFVLERAMELADETIDSRMNVFLLDSGIGDGGHFVMFTNLVKKYGVVPSSEMPDLNVSQDTGELNTVLTSYLTHAIMELREAKKKEASVLVLKRMKEGYLNDIYRILSLSLGEPVKEFTLEYQDKDEKFHRTEKMTPMSFYNEYIKADLDDFVCLCDAPIEGMDEYQKYTSRFVNNVEGGDPIVFFNVPLATLKKAALASLEGGDPIWFGSDVLAQSMRKEGILASGIIRSNELFSLKYTMTKSERLTYRSSFCNHAMTLTGVNVLDDKTTDRWKVENSWGKDNGFSGYFIMSDKWFDDYVYEIFVKREYVDAETLKKYDASTLKEQSVFNTLWAMMK